MTDKEQIICKYKFQDKEKFENKPYCTCFNELCEDLSFVCDHNCQIFEDYKQLARKTQECEELKERIKCNCFDPKSNNNRCISYNRIAKDYERDLKHKKNKIAECEKYEQLFDELDKRVSNCIEIFDCIIVSKIVKDIINKTKDGNND